MALNVDELLVAYEGLMEAYPEDVHVARYLIHMLQERGRVAEARDKAMIMARRMLSLGYSSYAIAFISLCERLEHPDEEEIASMRMMADLTVASSAPHGDGKSFELIEGLSDAESNTFLRQGTLLHLDAGFEIVKQGEVSRTFYIILDGELSVDLRAITGLDINLRILGKGEFFGEFACLYSLPRMASVTTVSKATLLEFPDTAVDELVSHSPLAGESLMRVVQRRMVESVSLSHPAFEEIEQKDRDWLASESRVLEYLPAEKFDEDCITGRFFYIIIFGKVHAIRDLGNGIRLQCDLETSSMFACGEHMLGFPGRTALQMRERCLVGKVPIEIFNSFSNAYRGFESWVKKHTEERKQKLEPK